MSGIKDLMDYNQIIQIPFEQRRIYCKDIMNVEDPEGWIWTSKQLHLTYEYTIFETYFEDIFAIRVDREESEMYVFKGTFEQAREFLGTKWVPSHFVQPENLLLFFDKVTGRSFVGSRFLKG